MRISDWSSDVCSSDLNSSIGEIAQFQLRCLPGLGSDRNEHQETGIGLPDRDTLAAHFFGQSLLDQRELVLHIHLRLVDRSEEHTSELQSLMRISYAVFCLKKKKNTNIQTIRDEVHELIPR